MSSDLRPKGTTGSLSGGEHTSGTTGRLRPPIAPAPLRPPESKSTTAQTALPLKFTTSEFNTAMVHFYRGEVQRSNTWRNRLDTTTNWAVITAGATLSFAFSSTTNAPHFVIPINSVLVAFFLFMEARRYRYYEIWSSRVRLLETGYFAQLLGPQNTIDREWAERLAADLITPHFTISEWEAVGRRLRRNYLWIFILLAVSWNLKVYLHPAPAVSFDRFLERAAVGEVPGSVVFLIGVIFNLGLLIFAIATVRLREATGEVLPRHDFSFRSLTRIPGLRTTGTRSAATRRAKQARHRVRATSSNLSGEFKKIDISETSDRKTVAEETVNN